MRMPATSVGSSTNEIFNACKRTPKLTAADRRKSPPGEGPALLQGLVVCGVCGRRMTLRYHTRNGRLTPTYVCQREGIEHAQPICQSIPGHVVDEAISQLVLSAMKPVTLEVALAVQQELEQRLEEADRLRQQRVVRARYEADLAQQRFMQVDPKNRLVADALEAEWNDRLRALSEAQDQYEQQSQADRSLLDEQSRERIRELATDFPRLWNDPQTPDRQRKRMIRLLIEDVTLSKDESHHRQRAFQRRSPSNADDSPTFTLLGSPHDRQPKSSPRSIDS